MAEYIDDVFTWCVLKVVDIYIYIYHAVQYRAGKLLYSQVPYFFFLMDHVILFYKTQYYID
jgi:hypothetical protein